MLKVVLASAILASASAFAPSGMPSGSRIMYHSATAARVSPLGTPVVGGRSRVRAASLALRAAEDADLALFSGLESAEFDGGLSQTDHIAVSGAKATKTTDDTPAFAIFGSGKSSGVEKVSVKVRHAQRLPDECRRNSTHRRISRGETTQHSPILCLVQPGAELPELGCRTRRTGQARQRRHGAALKASHATRTRERCSDVVGCVLLPPPPAHVGRRGAGHRW